MTTVACGFSLRCRYLTVLVMSMPPLTIASPSTVNPTADTSGSPVVEAVASRARRCPARYSNSASVDTVIVCSSRGS